MKMNKTKILLLLILFLVTTNIVTIIAVMKASRSVAQSGKNYDLHTSQRTGFFRDQLSLDQSQESRFMELNHDFNQEARQTTGKIEGLRFQMIDEMAGENPDTAKLNFICSEIGSLHCQLKKATVGYYLGMKEVCTAGQEKELHQLFRVMADPDGDINNLRHGMGMQKGKNGMRGMRGKRGPMSNSIENQ